MEESESKEEKREDETAMDLVKSEESEEEFQENVELKAARRLELKKKALQRQEVENNDFF